MRAIEVEKVILLGLVLIALGMTPGLFERVREGIENFAESLRSPLVRPGATHRSDSEQAPRAIWLAFLGVGLILLSMLSYILNSVPG